MIETYSLRSLSKKSLEIIASYAAGRKIEVYLSERLADPAVFELDSGTVYLDPARCGLYDALLLSRMSNHGKGIQRFYTNSATAVRSEPVPNLVAYQWLVKESRYLKKRYPGIDQLSGLLKPERHAAMLGNMPKIIGRGVTFKPLNLEPNSASTMGNPVIVEFTDKDIHGKDQDMQILLNALETNQASLPEMEDIPEFKFAKIDGVLTASQGMSISEIKAEVRTEFTTLEKYRQNLMQCLLAKAEGVMQNNNERLHYYQGIHIDPLHLHHAYIAHLNGNAYPIFRNKKREQNSHFNPEQHLSITAIDINSMKRGTMDSPGMGRFFYYMLAEIYDEMGVDMTVVAFRDVLVTMKDGSHVYGHMPFVLKRADEPMSKTVWARLHAVWHFSNPEYGIPVCYPPLHFEVIDEIIKQQAAEKKHLFYHLMYFCFHSLDKTMLSLDLSRNTVAKMEKQLLKMASEHEGQWNYELLLPASLRNVLPKRGLLFEALISNH